MLLNHIFNFTILLVIYVLSLQYLLFKIELMDFIAAITVKPFKGVMLNAVLHSSTAPNKPKVSTTTAEHPKLLITIPDSSIELQTLEVTLEAAVSMECNKDFTLEKLSDNMVAMNFRKHLSNDGKF